MFFDQIEHMVKTEYSLSGRDFIDVDNVDNYVNKIKNKAELVAHIVEGVCVGFIAFYANDEAKENAFITMVMIRSDMRGRKIAGSLLTAVLENLKSRGFKFCNLEVRTNNTNAIKLYENLGFKIKSINSNSIFMFKELF
ncbi:GNAT family N-acetyltransferase [Acinetobacter radioresistens]|uniref:GNAT family N-acetyltransferase n=1 Tax=Acinetobacter radioresistens TaxID=40216 RepID=UPI00355628FE